MPRGSGQGFRPGVQARGSGPKVQARGSGPEVQVRGSWFQVHHQHQLKEFFVFFSILKRHSTQSLQSSLQDYAEVEAMLELNNP